VRANLHFPPAVLYATQTKGMKNVTSSFETVFHRLVPSFQVPPSSATKSSASTLNIEILYFHFISPAPSYFRENSNRCQHNSGLPTIATSLVLRKAEETRCIKCIFKARNATSVAWRNNHRHIHEWRVEPPVTDNNFHLCDNVTIN